jgi:hypothetical protein
VLALTLFLLQVVVTVSTENGARQEQMAASAAARKAFEEKQQHQAATDAAAGYQSSNPLPAPAEVKDDFCGNYSMTWDRVGRIGNYSLSERNRGEYRDASGFLVQVEAPKGPLTAGSKSRVVIEM